MIQTNKPATTRDKTMDDKFLGRIRILSKIHQEIKQINSWIADFLFYFADCGFLDSKQTNLQHQGIRQTFRLQKIPNTQSTLEYPKYTRVPKILPVSWRQQRDEIVMCTSIIQPPM